jgi:hypothetical protein
VLEAEKVGKLRDHGYMDLGYSGFVNDGDMKKGWIPQPRVTWVSFLGKRRPSGMMTKKNYVYDGNKGFIQLPNE